ncbi:MAG: hypothetical protein UU76_C0013G0015, partial [Parcubacteria group bacterium GW2011_GWC1_41_7]
RTSAEQFDCPEQIRQAHCPEFIEGLTVEGLSRSLEPLALRSFDCCRKSLILSSALSGVNLA